MSKFRFRVGDGPEYEAEVPDGDYELNHVSFHVDDDGAVVVHDTMTLRPVGGQPFEVAIKLASTP